MRELTALARWFAFALVSLVVTISASGQTLKPTSLTFAGQVVGTSSSAHNVTLTNTQSVALSISSIVTSGDFSEASNCPLSPNTLKAGFTCTIAVTFTPTALGTRTGQLTVTDNSANSPQVATLTGTGVAPATLQPTGLNFASVFLDTTSSAKVVTLTNNQAAALSISSISTSGNFAETSNCPLAPATLASHTNCSISVTFTPLTTGLLSGTLTVNDNASNGPQTASLSGSGILPVTVSPLSLSFPAQLYATTSKAQVVTLQNKQATPLSISAISASANFAAASNCPISPNTLAAGKMCGVSVTFTPTALGQLFGTLTIVDNAGTSPQGVSLSGTGTLTGLNVISVLPANPSLAAGTSMQLTAIGILAVGQQLNITDLVTWSSSAPSVAQVSSTGFLQAVAPGTAIITASNGSVNGPTTVTVTAPTLTSITVSPGNPSVGVGGYQQFSATLNYSDGSQKDATNVVNWSSSSPTVAGINTSGLTTAASTGSTTIQASSEGIAGNTTLTVTQPQCLAAPPGLIGWWTGDGNTVDLGGNNSGTLQYGATYNNGEVGQAFNFPGGGASVLVNSPVYSPTAGTLMFWFLSNGVGAMTGEYDGDQNRAPGFSIDQFGNLNWEFGDLYGQPIGQISSNEWHQAALTYSTANSETAVSVYLDGAQVADAVSAPNTSWYPQVSFGAYLGAQETSFVGSMDEIAIFNQALEPQQIEQIYNAFSGGMCKPTLQSMNVAPSTPTVGVGTPLQFDAVGTYSDNSTHDLTTSSSWTSSNSAVATVAPTGIATSISPGQSTIMATLNSFSNSATLTVTSATLVSIAVNPANPFVSVGGTQPFTATGTYSDGSNQDLTSAVTWNSTNVAVATIDVTGLATTLTTGATTITATLGATFGSTILAVTQPGATLVAIAVNPPTATVSIGQNLQFTAQGQYSDGSTQDLTTQVTWSSTQPSIAGISGSGLTGALTGGSTQITATFAGIIGSATLNVNSQALLSIAVIPANPSIASGTNQQFAAIATYADGSTLDLTSSVSWTAAPNATITPTGLATATALGQSSITATAASVVGSATLTATSATLVSLVVSPLAPTVPQGIEALFTATGTFSDGTTQDMTASVQWSSSNTAVATVSSGGDPEIAIGVTVGTSTISAASGSVAASATIAVSNVGLASITVNPPNPSIAMGTTQQFSATGVLNDGSTMDVSSFANWSSSSPGIVSVSATGLGLAVTSGAATITASLGSISGSTTLTVTQATIVSVVVNPATAAMPLGINQPFTAQGTFSDGTMQDVTNAAHWSSSTPTVATISDSPGTSGLAAGVASGATTISATLGSVSGMASLTVTAAALSQIQISPANPTLGVAGSVQLTATGIYTDGSTANLTNTVTWASSAATVAVVSNNTGSQGLATAIGSGAATVSATLGSVQASTGIVVQDQLVSLAISPNAIMVPPGGNLQFTATGTYASGLQSNLTASVVWNSSNLSVSGITPLGVALAQAVGETTITASLGSVAASANLGVTPIQHVVMIVQENRTPDNLFQDPILIGRGADIASSGLTSTGQILDLQPEPLANTYDMPHSHSAFLLSSNNGEMNGFNLNCAAPCNNPPDPNYFYVQQTDVAPYFQMAEQYTFGDRMFQTNQGPSFPAHQFLISGTSAPTATSDLYAAENTVPFNAPTGCTAAPNVTVALIDPTGDESQTQYPCFEHPTLTDLLDAQSISWRYYAPGPSSIWTGPNAIEHIRNGPDWSNVIMPQTQVLTNISNGKLPAVSWIIPNGQESDHPGINNGTGPSWVASVVNAIGNSSYWANTAIFITWDDWGGWYDHVPPPYYNSYEYGFRVPLIVISPYVNAGYISHATHHFGSFLKFIEETYNLPSLGYADARGDDFFDCFNFSQTPLPFQTINSPYGPEYFLNDKTPPLDPDDD